jgi:hypothetical protein
VDLERTKAANPRKPIFGRFRDRIQEIDPDWWKPMTEEEVDTFLEGRY